MPMAIRRNLRRPRRSASSSAPAVRVEASRNSSSAEERSVGCSARQSSAAASRGPR
jgi:hypothetical protein